MKIAIIADTHDNLDTLHQTLLWIKKENIKTIIHCGDVGRPETLEEIKNKFKGPINLVLGNMDSQFKSKDNVKVWDKIGEIVVDNKKIAFTHFPGEARQLAKSDNYDIVFYGHTHKPWQEKIGNCRLVNPGNLAGMFYKATFAVYGTGSDTLELKILERLDEVKLSL